MEVLILLLVIGVVFVFFIMKGESGKSFYKNRKEIHKTVKQKGGMYELYKDFVDYFKEQDFQLREINKDSLYLHYGTWDGKVGIQIIQITPTEAEIVMGCELPSGQSHEGSIKVNIDEDQETMIHRLIGNFSNDELVDFKNTGLKLNRD
ncbi:hypothetical protein [Fodinibius salsisoli]|uniref:Uncharacterized protein n=1 Tax=Fodinibius salsisoli TaxID=2820877 RepID=A0ABT3PIT6_9BACT|nr:hypothetical protein [Fodinibius salsisoli]MCW9705805.1 hypothetical protein [Fodinibius salsisoli]